MEEEKVCAKCAASSKRMDIDDEFPVTVAQLGKGTFGSVSLKKNPDTGEQVAVKESINHNDDPISDDVIREISTLRALAGHPNVVKMIGYNLSPDGTAQIALEAATDSLAGSLKKGLNNLGGDTDVVKNVMFQIVNAMYYMNGIGIWHRDLKPQNVLVFPGNVVKVTDFGLSQGGPFQWISTANVVYTLWYRAPEILINEIYGPTTSFTDPSVYNAAAEVFSVGCTMWDVLCGTDPFDAAKYIKGNDVSMQMWKFIRGLGKDNFDWDQCVSGRRGCSLDNFVDAYAKMRTQDKEDQIAQNKTFRELKDEIRNLPNTTEMHILTKIPGLSDDCKSLLAGLLHPNPAKRMTMKQALDHTYFDSVRARYTVIEPPNQAIKTDSLKAENCGLSPFYKGTDINMRMYKILVEWLNETVDAFNMAPAVLSLALVLLQCYMQRLPINRRELQGYGVACLLLASIYTQDNNIQIAKLVYVTDNAFRTEQISEFAIKVFEETGGLLSLPTPFVVLAQKIHDAGIEMDATKIKPYAKKLYDLQNSEEALMNKTTDEDMAEQVFQQIMIDQNDKP